MTHETLHLSPVDRGRYLRVPFDVPRSTEPAIHVRVSFDESRATLDLGLWDPDGWRGYSGGARREVILVPGAATPGYLQDDVPAGRWAVEIGVYRVTSEVEVEVTIDFHTGVLVPKQESNPAQVPKPRLEPRGSSRALAAPDGLSWFAGDFHAHSHHSDGSLSLDELAAEAVSNGLDFLAITEHNTVSHHRHIDEIGRRQGITLVPGQELTTDRGHANVFGDVGWIDFHQHPDKWVRAAQERGAIMSINHPIADHCGWLWRLDVLPPALELWHHTWFADSTGSGLHNNGAWAFWERWRTDAVVLGGSDFHNREQGHPPGFPTTWVAARDCTVEAILEGVVAGRTAISRGDARLNGHDLKDEPVLVAVGTTLVAYASAGLALVSPSGHRELIPQSNKYTLSVRELGPWRLEAHTGALVAIASIVGS